MVVYGRDLVSVGRDSRSIRQERRCWTLPGGLPARSIAGQAERRSSSAGFSRTAAETERTEASGGTPCGAGQPSASSAASVFGTYGRPGAAAMCAAARSMSVVRAVPEARFTSSTRRPGRSYESSSLAASSSTSSRAVSSGRTRTGTRDAETRLRVRLDEREADDGDRTRDPRLGKPMLYRLSYVRADANSSPAPTMS